MPSFKDDYAQQFKIIYNSLLLEAIAVLSDEGAYAQ